MMQKKFCFTIPGNFFVLAFTFFLTPQKKTFFKFSDKHTRKMNLFHVFYSTNQAHINLKQIVFNQQLAYLTRKVRQM